MPSILSFSTVLCYYGGKLEMRILVNSLAKGGAAFYDEKVKNGEFFKSTVLDSNLLILNQSIASKFEASRSHWKENPVSPIPEDNKMDVTQMFSQAATRQEENKEQAKVFKFHNALFRNLMISVSGPGASLESFKKIVCGHAKENGWEQCIKFRHINFSMLYLFQ